MHGAPLPVFNDQFLPRDKYPNRGNTFIRKVKHGLRRQNAVKNMKRLVLALSVILLLVKFVIAPYKLNRQHASNAVSFDISGAPGEQPKEVRDKWGPQVEFYDFSKQTANNLYAANYGERVLICMPLRNAEPVMDLMFSHLHNLTYPHNLIDIAFLVSDSTDNTYDTLFKAATDIQTGNARGWDSSTRFNRIDIYKHDFGATIGQGIDARHGVAVQAERRKLMGRARNWLLLTALKPHHSWVYWRDADIEISEPAILEDLMRHDQDVIVPNVWRPLPKWLGGQQPYDLNSWQESDAALALAENLDENDVIVEGYAEYPTWRIHLAYLRDNEGKGDPNEIMDLDGIGGVSILAKAKVFRSGATFPGFAFLSHAETEGFGKMCRRMGFSVSGLVHYTVWHKYEPSEDDILKMEEMKAQGLPID